MQQADSSALFVDAGMQQLKSCIFFVEAGVQELDARILIVDAAIPQPDTMPFQQTKALHEAVAPDFLPTIIYKISNTK